MLIDFRRSLTPFWTNLCRPFVKGWKQRMPNLKLCQIKDLFQTAFFPNLKSGVGIDSRLMREMHIEIININSVGGVFHPDVLEGGALSVHQSRRGRDHRQRLPTHLRHAC